MRVFVTGATGFVGSAVVDELIAAGHQVLGLARSDAAVASLTAAGAEVHRGDLDDLDGLRAGAAVADGVVHTAYRHDLSDYAASSEADRRAVTALGTALAGGERPFVATSVTPVVTPGRVGTEEDPTDPESPAAPRIAPEEAALATPGVRAAALRLPPSVHGDGDHGFVPALINIARGAGVSAYPGEGTQRWPAVHRLDAARLYRLALESAPNGAKLHAVAEEGVPVRDIAEIIGKRLELPVVSLPEQEAAGHFGWLARFFAVDQPMSSALTRQRFGWHPVERTLLADIDHERYFQS